MRPYLLEQPTKVEVQLPRDNLVLLQLLCDLAGRVETGLDDGCFGARLVFAGVGKLQLFLAHRIQKQTFGVGLPKQAILLAELLELHVDAVELPLNMLFYSVTVIAHRLKSR